MNQPIEAVSSLAAAAELQATVQVADPVPTGRFGDWFAHELGQVNGQLVQAEQAVQQLASGDATSLHDVMIKLEEARLSFQLAVQVRSRVLEAYQDVMRMQV